MLPWVSLSLASPTFHTLISQRNPGEKWDMRVWKVGLANESDTQGSIRIPFGLLVDHVQIPEFYYGKEGLSFNLAPLNHGANHQNIKDSDYCLAVKLRVKRNSGKKNWATGAGVYAL